jgi:mannose-6-phosphate isomerase-like protein (cupin superfamily)
VLSGKIALYRQETRSDVKAGESFYYEADKPHRIENPGSRPARFIWVSTPPSF